jgi:hypothetical protein
VNHKRVDRIVKAHNLLLARKCTERPDLTAEAKVVTMRSKIRSPAGSNRLFVPETPNSPAGMETSSAVPPATVLESMANTVSFIDAQDRQIISAQAVVNAGSEGPTAIGPRLRPERIRDPRDESGAGRAAVRKLQHAPSRRDAERQWLVLHRP